MKTSIIKRSVLLNGHRTSVSLEDEFWLSLREIAKERAESVAHLIASIDAKRKYGNLSSALRLFILDFHRGRRTAPTHRAKSLGPVHVR